MAWVSALRCTVWARRTAAQPGAAKSCLAHAGRRPGAIVSSFVHVIGLRRCESQIVALVQRRVWQALVCALGGAEGSSATPTCPGVPARRAFSACGSLTALSMFPTIDCIFCQGLQEAHERRWHHPRRILQRRPACSSGTASWCLLRTIPCPAIFVALRGFIGEERS